MSVKRLAVPLCAVVSLLAFAGVLQLLVAMLSSGHEAVAAESIEVQGATPIVSRVGNAIAFEQRVEKSRQVEAAVTTRSLVEPGLICVEGAPIDMAMASELVEEAAPYTANVRYIDQGAVLPSGCELVAAAVAMNAEGIEVAPGDFVRYLRFGSNAESDYLGDPSRNGGGLAPVVAEAVNAWASEHGSPAHAHNLSGTSFEGALALAELGYPVVAWTTEDLVEPVFSSSASRDANWYSPEHCVVVYGTDGDDVLVSDSLEGLVRRDRAQFSRVYESCGRSAILVK